MLLARPIGIIAALVLLTALAQSVAEAQEMGVSGDPAIRSLSRPGHRHHHGRRHRHRQQDKGIEIPSFVRHIAKPADQLPPGATGPRSRSFIPAR